MLFFFLIIIKKIQILIEKILFKLTILNFKITHYIKLSNQYKYKDFLANTMLINSH